MWLRLAKFAYPYHRQTHLEILRKKACRLSTLPTAIVFRCVAFEQLEQMNQAVAAMLFLAVGISGRAAEPSRTLVTFPKSIDTVDAYAGL